MGVGAELKPRTYYWRMRSLRAADEAANWGKPHRFEVTHVKPGKPVAEAAPEPRKPQPPPVTPLTPKLKPEHGRLGLAFTPTKYRYEATGGDPETKIDALLFNAQKLSASLRLRPGLALDADYARTAATLFKSPGEGDPPGQRPLKISPFRAQLVVRWRWGDDLSPLTPYLDLGPGYGYGTYLHFTRQSDQTVSVTAKKSSGPLLALAGGIRFSQESSAKLGIAASAAGVQGSLVAYHDFASPGFGIHYGVEASQEKTEVTVLTQAVILGLGYNF